MSSTPSAAAPGRAKLLTQQGLQDLRAQLFRLELSAVHQMIARGVDATSIAVLADLDRAIEAVERLQLPTRERS
jgi:predicted metal-dependent HD superfamily phosphohydrolase